MLQLLRAIDENGKRFKIACDMSKIERMEELEDGTTLIVFHDTEYVIDAPFNRIHFMTYADMVRMN